MRLRNNTITLGLKRKSLPPVIYKLIEGFNEFNVRMGTKWFKPRAHWDWPHTKDITFGVLIHQDGAKRFISNSWYDINTNGTYEEFEESFNKWMESL